MIYDLQPRRGTPKRKRYKTAHWIEAAFLFTGLGCVLVAGIWLLQTKAYQAYDSYMLDRKIERSEVPTYGRPKARETGSLIGRIEIPRVKISAMMQEGVDKNTLSRAVGHVPSTPVPGQPGNVGVAAHRDSFFRGLRNIRRGDRIQVTTEDGRFQYQVESTRIVAPENIEVLDPTPQPAITLVTCYPFNYIGAAPQRFIVRARMLKDDDISAAVATPRPARGT